MIRAGQGQYAACPPFLDADMPATGCVGCQVCNEIEKQAGSDWCFEWLQKLKEFETSQESFAKARQVYLQSKYTDLAVVQIRSKLAVLQTQMVTKYWIILFTKPE